MLNKNQHQHQDYYKHSVNQLDILLVLIDRYPLQKISEELMKNLCMMNNVQKINNNPIDYNYLV